MRLVIYSGGRVRENEVIHDALSTLAGSKTKKSFTYVPFCSEGSATYFQRAVRRYSRFGFNEFECLPVDRKVSPELVEKAFQNDVIYLAGGNTFYFLSHLKRSGLMPRLKQFAKNGGVIAGLSAGAILLTPHISLAGYPEFDKDENDVGLRNLKALDLVNFEFFPHFTKSPRVIEALAIYSENSNYPVIGCRDGGGIIVEDGRTQLIGEIHLFSRGVGHRIS